MLSVLCACVVVSVGCASAQDLAAPSETKLYTGSLSPECVSSYHQIFVTRRVPPRNYQYHHEVADLETKAVPFKWRIVGGTEVDITNIPYQVMYGLYCGGSLIAPIWVLTAAHCRDKEKFVLAGATRRSQATRYKVCAHFIHPRWDDENKIHPQDFDYQLVLLETPVPVTPSSRPIAIGNVEEVTPGAVVSVSGWGYTRAKERHMQEILRRVYVPIMSHDQCVSLPNQNYRTISPRMFCAGFINGTKDSCQGDSGGPAVHNGKLIGLVSFGVGCAQKDQPGVYSNVPQVRDWIRSVTTLPL
ncbi:trypsin-like [Ostrinia furnacalis]|uniref:trypsin-like n=1 Tax=Ostrinia furnacalis TaxID=93504 RepID=UPI00103C78F4|nr:trypsin-like [Ostrinia furnacalis]